MTNRLLSTSHGTNREAFTGRDWARFVSIGLIWGASFLFIEVGLEAFHPGLVTWMRVGFGALFMAMLPRARSTPIRREDRPRVALLAVVWVAIPLTLFPIAQQWIDSAVAGMLNGAVPIFTAIIASVLLRQLPGRLQIAGLIVGFVGILAIALPSAEIGEHCRPWRGPRAGGLHLLWIRHQHRHAAPTGLWVDPGHGTHALGSRRSRRARTGSTASLRSTFDWGSLAALMALGLLGTGLAYIIMGGLAGSVGPTRASFITYLIPVVALVLGVVFRDEIVAPVAIVGSLLVIAGAFLASRRETPAASHPQWLLPDVEDDDAA